MKIIIIAIAVIVLLIIAFLLKTLSDAGEFKRLTPHFSGTVRKIPGVTGGEDITIDHEKRIAIISADNRFATLQGKPGFGGIYILKLDSPDVPPKLLKRIPDNEIHPHGISYYKSPEGAAYLYVVDHTDGKHSILLYQFKDDVTLVLLNTFSDPEFLISPNDVAAVDEHRFYFTNDHGSRSAFGKMMEDYLQLKKSNVIYYDGKSFKIAAKNIPYCNGININKNLSEAYVASSIGKNILVYKRDEQTGALDFIKDIQLDTGVDNIELDEHGNLWTAGHPKLLTFVRHSKDTSRLSPSHVIKINRDNDGNFISEEIYLNLGEELSASSVAAVSGNILLIGPVFDHHLLRCEMSGR